MHVVCGIKGQFDLIDLFRYLYGPLLDDGQDMVTLRDLEDEEEIAAGKDMIWRHALHTDSRRAWKILSNWDEMWPLFVKVLPKDYERMLQAIAQAELDGLSGDEAIMVAFESNKRDLARITGN